MFSMPLGALATRLDIGSLLARQIEARNGILQIDDKEHAAHCVANAILAGDAKDQTEKFNEIGELFGRYVD